MYWNEKPDSKKYEISAFVYSQKFFLATTELFIESDNVYIETKRNVDPYIAFLVHPCVVVWQKNQD